MDIVPIEIFARVAGAMCWLVGMSLVWDWAVAMMRGDTS